MKKKISLIATFLFSITVFSQSGTIDLTFNDSFGGFLNGQIYNTSINDAKIQSDGKIIIVGNFSFYNGTAGAGIARMNVDFSIDTTFNIGTTGTAGRRIKNLVIQSDGKIIIGGNFESYNGIARKNIARINTDGSLDLTFNPGFGPDGAPVLEGSTINNLKIQSDGKIIISGNFTSYNGTPRKRIARLNTDGTLDTSFDPGTGDNNYVYSTSIQSDGKIIIGGNFTSYNGTPRNRIARLNTDGTLDTSFDPGTGASNTVYSTSIQNDGKIIIGGNFNSYNGTPRNRIARLNTDGTLDTSFDPGTGTNGLVVAIFIQSDDRIIIGGSFNSYNGNPNRGGLIRLNSDGTFDSSFDTGKGLIDNPTTQNIVKNITLLNDGKVLVTGDFSFFNSEFRPGFALLDSTGLLTEINKGRGVQGGKVQIVKNYGSKRIIGGTFTSYNGTQRRGIAMLNADGSLDLSFNNTVLGFINGVSSVSDIEVVGNKIIIVGSFTSYNGVSANRIIRLNSDGTIDNSFNAGTGANSVINTIARSGNKFLIGGNFTAYNGTSINKIARINFDGDIDNSFKPNLIGSAGSINTISIHRSLGNELYLAGGNFNAKGNSNVILCYFGITGGLGPIFSGEEVHVIFNDGTNFNYGILRQTSYSFNQVKNTSLQLRTNMFSLNGPIYSMSKQNDGKIIIGGDFTKYNGTPSNYLARLNTDGTLDTSFNIGSGPDNIVRTTSIQLDGKLIIGGDFTSYNGIARNGIARINTDAALSTIEFENNILNIFPNPSDGYFTIQIDNLIGTKTIEIYTIIGQKIYSKHLTENKNTLDLSNKSKGIYFYKIYDDNNSQIKSGKLILK